MFRKNMSGMAQKKERSTNFAPSEVELLINLVIKHAQIIESKKTDVTTWKDKGNEWEKLKEEFNASNSICQRTVKCLKTKYEGMKKDVKKKKALQKQNLYKTGGGDFKDVIFRPVEEKLLNLISFSVEGLPPRFDCDENNHTLVSEEIHNDVQASTSKNVEMPSDILMVSIDSVDFNPVTSDQLTLLEPDGELELHTSQPELSPLQTPQRTSNWSTWNPTELKKPLSSKLKRGCCGSTKRTTIVGGWAWAWWLVTDVQRLSLEVMTLNPMCECVETAQGVPLTVTGVAQCKIMKADELLHTASEQFLGKSVKEIKSTILQTLEGHLRAILGTLTVEEVYRDRDQFAALVREVAAPDVGRMGIEILSFTIKDVYDDVQYLASLGKAQTAMVKRDADAGVAEANRDAGIREAECEKSAMDIKYSTDTKIEDNSRMFQLQKAHFDQEVNTAKAEAQLAYELQAAKIRQKIRNEEIQIEVVERRKQIEVESKEVQRKERELNATVRLPAEAESYRLQTVAEGRRTQTVQAARADGEKIMKLGEAEAGAISAVGKADAERMRQKAAVYKQYGDAAIMSIVLEALPKIAAEVAAPLAKTEEIVLIGGSDNTTAEINRLVGQIPPAVHALTGVNLSKVLGKIPGATTTAAN